MTRQVTYFARLGPTDAPERPRGVLRRTGAGPDAVDEAMHPDGSWHPTRTLYRRDIGELDDRFVEITAVAVDRIATRWRQITDQFDADLAAQGRGEFGLRMARVPDPVRDGGRPPDAPLPAAHRMLVGDYLRDAPVVVLARGYDRDPFDPAGAATVPLSFHTDGRWVWSESLAYFADRYGIAPEPEFLAHIVAHRYRWPEVSSEVLDRAAALVGG